MPEPAAISFLGSGPSVARLNGMNIITEPTARKISGQKIVCTPVSGFSPISSTPVEVVISAPMPTIRRGSKREKNRPYRIIVTAEASAPGTCSTPLCVAV